MEKFKENKVSDVCGKMGVISFVLVFVSAIFGMIDNINFYGIIIFSPISFMLLGLSESLSKQQEYTESFIKYIRQYLDKADTLEKLLLVKNEFESLCIENGRFCLSYPHELKEIHVEINTKIQILNKYLQSRILNKKL
jgi:hypothetical protein